MLRLFVLFLFAIALPPVLAAQGRTQRLIQRLPQEAAAFQQIAPFILGQETLIQRALKPPPKFRVRVGKAATQAPPPEWQQRTIVSEYAYTTFEHNGPLHELRQVQSVDGKPVKNSKNFGPQALARIILANDQQRKRELVEQFASYGLRGAATDFGQLLLLFTPENMLRYEFLYDRSATLNGATADIFTFVQVDGPNPLTFVDESKSTEALRVTGQIWMSAGTYVPMRIVLHAAAGSIEQEATVDYKVSDYAAVLPWETHHTEMRDRMITAQNDFTYTNFKRFGASSGIVVEEEEPTPKK